MKNFHHSGLINVALLDSPDSIQTVFMDMNIAELIRGKWIQFFSVTADPKISASNGAVMQLN